MRLFEEVRRVARIGITARLRAHQSSEAHEDSTQENEHQFFHRFLVLRLRCSGMDALGFIGLAWEGQ